MASVTLNNLTKIYQGEYKAVNNVSFNINDGEFIVIVGPSGCGKSSTLRMIAGLENITGGEIHIGERLVNNIEAKNRNVSMVFQNYALYPHMSAFKNISFGLEMRKYKKEDIAAKVEEAAKILGIEHLLGRKPGALSGGEKQRVALGRAIVREPDVFLFDEPLSNLDAKLKINMRLEIIKLHKKLKATFIYVTHDQVEALTMADRIIVMDKGVVQQADTPYNLYNFPANIFVAGFIGSPAMNFINTKIIRRNGHFFILLCGNLININETGLDPSILYKYAESGKPVILGIRPEHIRIVDKGSFSEAIDTDIDFSEMAGADYYLYCKLCHNDITIRADNSIVNLNTVSILPDSKRLSLFDTETGTNLKAET